MMDGVDLSGELIDRRFQVEHSIGSGGMGTVWEVRHAESLQRFALKTLTPALALDGEAVARFLREARAAAALRTRHVVRIIDTQTAYRHRDEPLPFIVMELLEGRSLEELLTVRGQLEAGEVAWVFRQVCRALGVAHAGGIVHRDLKPANVFVALDEEGEPIVKLCDFGVAKLLGDAAMRLGPTNEVTATGATFGTPLYMAPEQLRSAGQATPATDCWALGLIAFRALSGREYFGEAPSPTELVLRIAQDEMPAPSRLDPRLPPAFDRWFARACHRDVYRRYGDAETLADELEVALGRPVAQVLHPNGSSSVSDDAIDELPARSDQGHLRLVGMVTVATLGAIVITHWVGAAWLEGMLAATLAPRAASAQGPEAAPSASVAAIPFAARSAPTFELQQAPPHPIRSVAPPVVSTRPPPIRGRPPRPVVKTQPVSPPSVPAAGKQRLESGQPCTRSSECASGLCLAEACR